ncbi:MAG TPA: AtzH-like domain-containing protein, partial [Glaciihabitans sp.]|nr:AtzH-like domain-containing protein [Glaciihabitans sp.]
MSEPTQAPVQLPAGVSMPHDLLAAFWEYERALMANALEALDRLFAPGPDTLRGDAAGLLRGHNTISAFRMGRGGSPARTIAEVHVRPLGDDVAVIVAVTAPATGGHGQQTQVWRRLDTGWAVEVAHVSLPAPAINKSIWRTVGSPLVAGTNHTAHDAHPAHHGDLPLD